MTTNPEYKTLDEATLDNLIEGYQLIGFDWRYLFVNNAVVKQSKYPSKNDLLGHTMMEKYPGIEKTEMFKVLKSCMKARVSKTILNEFIFPDNSKGWFELRIEPVPKGLFILSMDITERKKSELAKKDYVDSLEEMLFMTSHKVRQPLTNLQGILHLLEETKMTKVELKKVTDYFSQSLSALHNFTKELTTFIHKKKITIKTGHNKSYTQ